MRIKKNIETVYDLTLTEYELLLFTELVGSTYPIDMMDKYGVDTAELYDQLNAVVWEEIY